MKNIIKTSCILMLIMLTILMILPNKTYASQSSMVGEIISGGDGFVEEGKKERKCN